MMLALVGNSATVARLKARHGTRPLASQFDRRGEWLRKSSPRWLFISIAAGMSLFLEQSPGGHLARHVLDLGGSVALAAAGVLGAIWAAYKAQEKHVKVQAARIRRDALRGSAGALTLAATLPQDRANYGAVVVFLSVTGVSFVVHGVLAAVNGGSLASQCADVVLAGVSCFAGFHARARHHISFFDAAVDALIYLQLVMNACFAYLGARSTGRTAKAIAASGPATLLASLRMAGDVLAIATQAPAMDNGGVIAVNGDAAATLRHFAIGCTGCAGFTCERTRKCTVPAIDSSHVCDLQVSVRYWPARRSPSRWRRARGPGRRWRRCRRMIGSSRAASSLREWGRAARSTSLSPSSSRPGPRWVGAAGVVCFATAGCAVCAPDPQHSAAALLHAKQETLPRSAYRSPLTAQLPPLCSRDTTSCWPSSPSRACWPSAPSTSRYPGPTSASSIACRRHPMTPTTRTPRTAQPNDSGALCGVCKQTTRSHTRSAPRDVASPSLLPFYYPAAGTSSLVPPTHPCSPHPSAAGSSFKM